MKHTILTLFGFLLLALPMQVQAGEYDLTIAREAVNITGNTVKKITVNGTIPGPTLRFTEGEDVTIHVTNKMDEDTSVHWHGLLLPGEMDGVPGFNGFPGIKPGETFTYHFKIVLKSVKTEPIGITHTLWDRNKTGITVLLSLRPNKTL